MKVVHCKKEKYDVYIGRPSIWGNPYTHINDKKTAAQFIVSSREEAIEKYEDYLRNNKELLELLPTLKDKILGCWCSPKPCHGDILIKLYNEYFQKDL
jgi:hypothetical protein